MKPNPKWYLVALALLTAGAQPVESRAAPVETLKTWAVFKKGHDLVIQLSYSGGLKGWDAAFGFDGVRLTTGNSAFLTVTDSEGKRLSPRADRILSKWTNTRAKEPFETRVDLAEVYDMSTPGRYTVEWGCEKVASQVIRIEVVEGIPDNGVDKNSHQ